MMHNWVIATAAASTGRMKREKDRMDTSAEFNIRYGSDLLSPRFLLSITKHTQLPHTKIATGHPTTHQIIAANQWLRLVDFRPCYYPDGWRFSV